MQKLIVWTLLAFAAFASFRGAPSTDVAIFVTGALVITALSKEQTP